MFGGIAPVLANLRLKEIQRDVAQQRGQRYEESKESESELRRKADLLHVRRNPVA